MHIFFGFKSLPCYLPGALLLYHSRVYTLGALLKRQLFYIFISSNLSRCGLHQTLLDFTLSLYAGLLSGLGSSPFRRHLKVFKLKLVLATSQFPTSKSCAFTQTALVTRRMYPVDESRSGCPSCIRTLNFFKFLKIT